MKRYFLPVSALVFGALLIIVLTAWGLSGAQADGEKISWKEAQAKDFSASEELARRTIYEDWKSPKVSKNRPLLFYFYWPTEDKTSATKEVKTQAENTEKMDKVLGSDAVEAAARPFLCIKVNLRDLKQWGSKGEALAAKYGVSEAPALVFFDRGAFPQGVTEESAAQATLAEKLKFVAGIGSSGSGDNWTDTDALQFKDEKTLKKRSVFEDWKQARELGQAKPMIFFFYWPVKDKKSTDKAAKSQAEKTEQLEKVLTEGDVPEQLGRFYCFKVNVKELASYDEEGAAILKKYRVKKAPVLVVFDYKGNRLLSIPGKQKASTLAKKLKQAADKSDKQLKK